MSCDLTRWAEVADLVFLWVLGACGAAIFAGVTFAVVRGIVRPSKERDL